ncbi:hypothetical protein [Goodfellowiella coeruleoviolacea]|uniref:hypothetical protein n=1 Tax=Goodfellowiella coeruleoviolacea TaxID=334858 RepID=UPI0020A40DB3|nr:hypothetical protein [Goodfellowiella coeruleoviolacea]
MVTRLRWWIRALVPVVVWVAALLIQYAVWTSYLLPISGLITLQEPQAAQLIYAPDGSGLQAPAHLGALVTVGAAGVPAGATVTVTCDERLYSESRSPGWTTCTPRPPWRGTGPADDHLAGVACVWST